MKPTIQFFAPGVPKGQPRPRAFARRIGSSWTARVFDPGTAEAWKHLIAMAAKVHKPAAPFEGPVKLRLVFQMPRPKGHFRSNGEVKLSSPSYHTTKPDKDNLEKAVMDALTVLGFWRDDSQVCVGQTVKLYTVSEPGVLIEISEPEN